MSTRSAAAPGFEPPASGQYHAMRGVVRPCRHRLGPELHARWLAHLCGLCLSLRDTAGQASRVLTGYDVLLVSVLTEAQAGRQATQPAGSCPLRGFRSAEVVDSATPALRAGVAAALLAGEAGLQDKVADGDAPAWLRPAVSRSADRLARIGNSAAEACGWDGSEVSAAPARARAIEARPGAGLDELLEPTGAAVAAMFAHTAVTSGVPGNVPALRRAGDAFGRLVHLIDAAQDRASDARRGRFNPLEATDTSPRAAEALARRLHDAICQALGEMALVDGALAEALLGPTLGAAIARAWPAPGAEKELGTSKGHLTAALAIGVAVTAQAARWVGGGRGGWRGYPSGYGQYPGGPFAGGPFGGSPYGGGRYYGSRGYRRSGGCGGPSCGELLACDCCANCACDQCCGGGSFCCCI